VVAVTVRRDARGRLSSLYVRGHADFADAGQDIVCAAVSAIVQAAWLGLEQVARVAPTGTSGDGTLSLRWPSGARGGAALEAIVATAELAVEQLAKQYPDHVNLARETET
jgi:uncharacterized protein